MALPLLLMYAVQVLLDLAVVIALVVALVSIAGIIKDFLVENLVDILVDMPDFGYSFQDGRETGGVLFDMYKRQRDMVVWPMILAGSLAWLVTGRFGHRVRAALLPERVRPVTDGVHPLMRPQAGLVERDGDAPHALVSFGRDHDNPGTGWFGAWFASLPSKSLLFLALLFVLPPVWDAAVEGSAWAANRILNPVYSGDGEYPCPRGWYVNGALDTSNPDLLAHHGSVRWLLAQDKTGELDAMCRPELRVRYLLEQWGGQTKAIPPPMDGGSFWEILGSMGENAGDWMIRGAGEFFVNIVLGVIKAQAVVMSGTAMIVSNMVVDIGVATMIVFAPIYFLLMMVPWKHIGGGRVLDTIRTYGPATLAAAVIYPIEVAVLFAVASDLMVSLLLSEYGNDLLAVWLFGTAITSMVVAVPIVSLGAFAQVAETVTGKFTALIQTAQGGVGAAAGAMGMRGGGVVGGAMGKMGGAGAAGGAAGKAASGVSKK